VLDVLRLCAWQSGARMRAARVEPGRWTAWANSDRAGAGLRLFIAAVSLRCRLRCDERTTVFFDWLDRCWSRAASLLDEP
jgi:hypothetical protein